MNQTEFLAKIKPFVIQDMKDTKILASLTAAQAFIESRHGESGLTIKANNLFGIKGTYNGQSVRMLTPEYIHHKWTEVYANFKKYPSWAESIADHSAMFHRLRRYHNLIGVTNYVTVCTLVKKDGYATDPGYTNTLIKTIERYMLYNWDKEVKDETTNTYPIPTDNIKLNDRGISVMWLQTALNQHAYNLKVDGIFGKNTLSVVMDYQKKNGLKVDGIAGVKTIAKLCEKV